MSSEDCSICCEPYNVTDRRPVLTPNCCGNTLCLQCAESHRAVQVAELSGNRKKIPCPLGCGAPFHSETGKFIVNRDKLRSLEGMGAAGSSSASSLAAASSDAAAEAAPSPDDSKTAEIGINMEAAELSVEERNSGEAAGMSQEADVDQPSREGRRAKRSLKPVDNCIVLRHMYAHVRAKMSQAFSLQADLPTHDPDFSDNTSSSTSSPLSNREGEPSRSNNYKLPEPIDLATSGLRRSSRANAGKNTSASLADEQFEEHQKPKRHYGSRAFFTMQASLPQQLSLGFQTSSHRTSKHQKMATAATRTPHPENGIARGILIGARIAKQFDVPTPTPTPRRSRPKQDQTKSSTNKRRRTCPPKNSPPPPPLPPARPETPPPTIKQIYYGTVTGYNHFDAAYTFHDDEDVGLYHVRYDDGDIEVLDPDDIYNAFLLHNDEMLRMDIELESKTFPVLASKIPPSWREGTPTGQIGGRGLAHQRALVEDEVVVLDAERIGYWENYRTHNLSEGVPRPVPYSPTGNRKFRASRTGSGTNQVAEVPSL